MREIGDQFGITCKAVFDFLKSMERKGLIKRSSFKARSLIILNKEAAQTKGRNGGEVHFSSVPVVGKIAAESPILAIENPMARVPIPKECPQGKGGYALKVQGESMIEAGIFDGDIAIIKKQDTAQNGDIVVALIGEEATLKRFRLKGSRIILEPANSRMQPIMVKPGEFRIQGKVVGIQRIL
jgi:repressor LexA